MAGRLSPISSKTLMKPQKADDSFPLSPSRPPARERSEQGKEAVAKLVDGIESADKLCISPRMKELSVSGNCSLYILSFCGSISLANTTDQKERMNKEQFPDTDNSFILGDIHN